MKNEDYKKQFKYFTIEKLSQKDSFAVRLLTNPYSKNDMSKCTKNSQTAVFALAKRGAGAKPLQEKTLSS